MQIPECTCERFSVISFWRVDDPSCPYHHPTQEDLDKARKAGLLKEGF